MKHTFLCILFCLATSFAATAQDFDVPVIGAQVFIEPGQTAEDIDEFFSILEQNKMKVARIRLFGVHIFRDGKTDFSLYDTAFDAAQRHGIKLFATLFPTTDELNDIGGFKFPRSRAHLTEVDEYVRTVVRHFRNHPALSTWVLQNEPGQRAYRLRDSDLLDEVKAQWKASLPKTDYDNGFLKMDFEREKLVTYYSAWYLKHINDIVVAEDPAHGRHANPFSILSYMTAHDYDTYSTFLTSLGFSMHYSGHFPFFNAEEYTMASSLMNDIIRSGARNNPYWVTEIQGGNFIATGRTLYCPTGSHIAQYMWTSLARGARGIIFWTLNPRAAVREAGEYSLIDFTRQPTERLTAARKIAEILEKNGKEIISLKPVSAPVTILYTSESFYIQRYTSSAFPIPADADARKVDAVEKALSVAYQAISAQGVCPEVCEMKTFDWNDGEGRVAIFPDCLSVPSEFWPKISRFVETGGKLIVTGRSFYYDENMFCTFMYRPFPLKDCFGAELKEFKNSAYYFDLGNKLVGHLWRGTLRADGATPVLTGKGEVLGTENHFGKGSVVWIPTCIELGAYHRAMPGLNAFYGKECAEAVAKTAVRFEKACPGVQLAALAGESSAMVVVSNKTGKRQSVKIVVPFDKPTVLDGGGSVKGRKITLSPDDFAVVLYRK